jgi:hypothetical protein
VDVTAPGGVGQTLGLEVKTYLRWRTVRSSTGARQAVRNEVPLNTEIRQQIHKDLAIRSADPTFDPRWVFLDGPPSQALREYLSEVGIGYIIYH